MANHHCIASPCWICNPSVRPAQLPLTWPTQPPPGPDVRDHAARWRAFVAERPDVAARVLAWLRTARDLGCTRISMAKCWEELRGTIGPRLLDNSWRRPAGVWAIEQDPSLDGLIPLKGARHA